MINLLHRLENGLLALLLASLLILSIAQIVLRLFDSGLIWAEPVSRMGVLWLALLGALGATRGRKHIEIDALRRVLPAVGQRLVWFFAQIGAAIVCGGLAWLGWGMLQLERETPLPFIDGVPSWVPMLAFPIGFGLMALRFFIAAISRPPPVGA